MAEKVLITGGLGFIGSHTTQRLIAQGYRVIIVDHEMDKSNAGIFLDAEYFECDILEKEFEDIVLRVQPDYIIHLAAQVSVPFSIDHMQIDEEVNIQGSIRVIQSAVKANVKKIIYSSTAAVYGIPKVLPISVDDLPSPVSPYGLSKYTVEKYLELSAKLYGLDYTILRYANVFGPGQDSFGEGGVISIFFDQILSGKKPLIFGNGEQTRDFIYVADVASANVQALNHGSRKVFNVSTGEMISINELFNIIAKITQFDKQPEYREEREGDIPKSALCNKETKAELQWVPYYSLQEGLEEMYNSILKNFHRIGGNSLE